MEQKILNQSIKNAHLEHLKQMGKVIHHRYGKKYNINLDQLYKFIESIDFTFTSTQKKMTKRTFKRKILPSKDRCQARVWKEGKLTKTSQSTLKYGEQCRNKKAKCQDYCRMHLKNLRHGGITSEPSRFIKGVYKHHNLKKKK